jgi:membrane protein implicated in regulation of membrane protease activity
VAALSGVLLLRKDRPSWPRPYRLAKPWLVVTAMLLAANVLFIVVGFAYFEETGYSSGTQLLGVTKELWGGVLILVASVLLFVYRRVVQDKLPFTWTESDDHDPHGPQRAGAVTERAPLA